MKPAASITASKQVVAELTDEERSKLCSWLYHKFSAFHKSNTTFQRLNPQSFLRPYGDCKQAGGVYQIQVENMNQINANILDDMRTYLDCWDECDAVLQASPHPALFLLPLWLPVRTLFPVRYHNKMQTLPPVTLWDRLDRALDPRSLITLLVMLVLFFVALFVVYKVPDEEKLLWWYSVWKLFSRSK